MNRIPYIVGSLALLAMLGCAPKNDQPAPAGSAAPATAAKEASAPATPASDGVLPMSYMDAAAALSVDDFDKAKVSLAALAKESTGDMQAKAQAAANAANIAAMRESFKELSDIASEMKLPADYAVAFCPMYKIGSKSKWVQKKEALANPYFGKTMQTCGSFVKS